MPYYIQQMLKERNMAERVSNGGREFNQEQVEARKEELRKDWPEDLNEISFESLKRGAKLKVMWRCHTCGHEWPAFVYNRWRKDGTGTGCPKCAGKVITRETSLGGKYPELLRFLDPDGNVGFDPFTVAPTKRISVDFRCEHGHRYERSLLSLVRNEGRCKKCAGQVATEDNNLAVFFPEIAAEWHPTRNHDLTPRGVTPFSNRMVWWRCSVAHSFRQVVNKRTRRGDQCPECWSRSSRTQNRVAAEMETVFGTVEQNAKVEGHEVDVWLPEFHLGFEIDGNYHHTNRLTQDTAKSEALATAGVRLIRLRDDQLPPIDGDVVLFHVEVEKPHIDQLLELSGITTQEVSDYIETDGFLNEEGYRELNKQLRSVPIEKSLLHLSPDVAAEWDYEANHPIRPEEVSNQANDEYFFICPRCGSSYEARVDHRTGVTKSGCECNRGRRFTEKVSLAALYPEIAAHWDEEGNTVSPWDIGPWDTETRLWKCPTCGEQHPSSTRSKVGGYRRRGTVPGCRSCGRKKYFGAL
jgi:rubrerythrin